MQPCPWKALGYVLRISSSIWEDGWDGEKQRWKFHPELGCHQDLKHFMLQAGLASDVAFRPVTRLNAIF